ncbi:MAG: GNAT family N-acetyltransferase [Flavobacteriales bacterium]|nr:MAG: GNAT family N-acetyltransferase [Flavobacteriales bacterium]
MDYRFERVGTEDASIAQATALLRNVFPKASHFTEPVVRWQYLDNPDGHVVGFNAFAGAVLAAHYVAIPLVARVHGKEERGLLSLNTATHPDHQGKGLFTKLANLTYEAAAREGFGFVIGVANANSTHGFTKKLGFQLVAPLMAMVGVGPITNKNEYPVAYQRIWHTKAVDWRLGHPRNKYYSALTTCRDLVLTDRTQFGARLFLAALDGGTLTSELPEATGWNPLRVWIGLDSRTNWFLRPYFNIPMRFRPSPLNLIFKDLTGQGRTLPADQVRFQAIDFDTL